MVDPVIVDDRDPRIQYAGVWEESGTSSELNGTTHGVRGLENEVVGNATFTFTGTSVAVFGTIAVADFRPSASVATIAVDGSDPRTFVPQKPSGTLFKQQFYQSSNLNDGEHTLFITISAFNSAMWIDYLQYTPPSSLTPTITQSSATSIVQDSQTANESTQPPRIDTISLSLSARSTDAGVPKDPTWTPSEHLFISSPTSPGSNQVPQGVIIGAASGGPFVFLALLFLLYRRWKKPTEHGLPSRSFPWWNFWSRRAPSPSSIITPFTLSAGSAAALELSASSSNNRFYHHDNYTSGSGYVTQGSASSEKTGLHLHTISQPNLMSFHNLTCNVDSDTELLRFQDLRAPSPVHYKFDSCIGFLPSPPLTVPPPSQLYVVDSLYDWPIDDSPPSYHPRILANHGHGG